MRMQLWTLRHSKTTISSSRISGVIGKRLGNKDCWIIGRRIATECRSYDDYRMNFRKDYLLGSSRHYLNCALSLPLHSTKRTSTILLPVTAWKRGLLTGETMAIIKEKHLKNLDQDGEKINDEVVDKNRIDVHILGREELGDESAVNDLNDGVVRAPQHHFDAAKVANEISMNTSLDDLWKNKFHRLVKFYKTVGYQRSEIEIVRKDQNLKLWIDRQRIQYQKEMRRRDRLKEVGDDINDNPPIMPQEKIDLLNGIVFAIFRSIYITLRIYKADIRFRYTLSLGL